MQKFFLASIKNFARTFNFLDLEKVAIEIKTVAQQNTGT